MNNFIHYLWVILLALYIISPLDALPLFWDDLIASGVLLYLIYRHAQKKNPSRQYYSNSGSYHQSKGRTSTPDEGGEYLTLDKAYQLLDVSPDTSLEEINRSYREKMSKSHPDKVSHLSKELQEKASEVTLKLNTAMDMIKKNRG